MTVNTTVNLIPQIKYTCTAVNIDYSRGLKNSISLFSTKSGTVLFDWTFSSSVSERTGFGNDYDFTMFTKDKSAGTMAGLKFSAKKNLLNLNNGVFSLVPDNSHETFDKRYKLSSKTFVAWAGGVVVPVIITTTYSTESFFDLVLTVPLTVVSTINTYRWEKPNNNHDDFADSFYSCRSKNVVTKNEEEYAQSNLVYSAKNVLSVNVDRNALPGKWVMAAIAATVPTVANLVAKIPDAIQFFGDDSESNNVKSESGAGAAVQIKMADSSVKDIKVTSTDSEALTVSLYYCDENRLQKSKSSFTPGVYLNLNATAIDDPATGNKVITGFTVSVSAYIKVKYGDNEYCIGNVKLVSQSVYWNEFVTCGLSEDDLKKVAKKKVDLSGDDSGKSDTYKKAILTNLAKSLEKDLIIIQADTSLYNACYCVNKDSSSSTTDQKKIDGVALEHAQLEGAIAGIPKLKHKFVAKNFAFTLLFEIPSDMSTVRFYSYLSGNIKLNNADLIMNSYTADSTGVTFSNTTYKATFSQDDSDKAAGNTGSGNILNSGGNMFYFNLVDGTSDSSDNYTYTVNKTDDWYPVMKKGTDNCWVFDKVNKDANFVIDPNSDIQKDAIYTDFSGDINSLFSAGKGSLLTKDSMNNNSISYSNIKKIKILAFGSSDNVLKYAGAVNSNVISFSLNNKDSLNITYDLYCCACEKKSFFIVRASAPSTELKMAGKNIDVVEKNSAVYKAFSSSDFGKVNILKVKSDYYLFNVSYSEKNGCFMVYISRVFSNSDFTKLDPFDIQDIANAVGIGMFCTAAAASVIPTVGALSLIRKPLPATDKELRINVLRKNIGIAAESNISVEIGGNTKMMEMTTSKISLENGTAVNLNAGNSSVNIGRSKVKLKVNQTEVEIKDDSISIKVGAGTLTMKQNEFMYGHTGLKNNSNKIKVIVSGNVKAEY